MFSCRAKRPQLPTCRRVFRPAEKTGKRWQMTKGWSFQWWKKTLLQNPPFKTHPKQTNNKNLKTFFAATFCHPSPPPPIFLTNLTMGNPWCPSVPTMFVLSPKPSAMICADVEELGNSQRCNKSTTTASRRQTLGLKWHQMTHAKRFVCRCEWSFAGKHVCIWIYKTKCVYISVICGLCSLGLGNPFLKGLSWKVGKII